MPINKNASERYTILDECFKNRKEIFFIDDLIETISTKLEGKKISRSTIDKDIKYMKTFMKAPIESMKDGKSVYYRYSNPDFSIKNEILNTSEKEQLKSIITTLSNFKGLPQFNWINDIAIKLQTTLKSKFSDDQIIFFESNPNLKGIEFFTDLFNAITQKQVLNITYKNFVYDKPFSWTFHPYILKEYNNRWFVFGLCKEENKIFNLAFDRIVKFENSQEKYIKTEINFEEYFEDVIGVTVKEDTDIETIELKFDKNRFNYIKTKPIHESQIVLNKRPNTIQLELKPNNEFLSLILSFGNDVEVLKPLSLRNQVKGIALKMLESYKTE